MKTYNIFTNEPDSLHEGKSDFLLVQTSSNASTEFIKTQSFAPTKEQDEVSKILYSPLLITRAVHNLLAFSKIESLDLSTKDTIDANAREIFGQGMAFGRSYDLQGSYLILAQSSQNTAQNTEETLKLLAQKTEQNIFESLSHSCDRSLIFCAGFLLEASRRFHIVVGGGFEMAFCLYLADLLREDVLMRLKSDNITYATTSWAVQEASIRNLLKKLSYTPHALYTAFSLEDAEIEELKQIALQEKDKAGAGAALAFGAKNSLTHEELLREMELIIYMS